MTGVLAPVAMSNIEISEPGAPGMALTTASRAPSGENAAGKFIVLRPPHRANDLPLTVIHRELRGEWAASALRCGAGVGLTIGGYRRQ